MPNLTQRYLKKILFYDPKTGIFIWKVNRRSIKVGDVAGFTQCNGYRRIKIDQKRYYASRLAYLYMEGSFPKEEMDHKNRIRNDNIWKNLQAVSLTFNRRGREKWNSEAKSKV